MNGDYHTLEKLAKNTNLLVAHNAVKGASGVAANLHMTPLTIGQIANYKCKKSGTVPMLRTLGRESETKKEIVKITKVL